MELSLSKDKYSETVVRKSLYWMSEYSKWTLHDDDHFWILKMYPIEPNSEQYIELKLHQLLNDFILREQIDSKSKYLRFNVIQRALEKVYATN